MKRIGGRNPSHYERVVTVYLASFRESTGMTALTGATTPKVIELGNLNACGLMWAAGNTDEIQADIQIPGDYDENADACTLQILVAQPGSTDTMTMDLECYRKRAAVDMQTAGDQYSGTAQSITQGTASDTPEAVSFALSSKTLLRHDVLTLKLIPAGSSADALYIFGAWLKYTAIPSQ